MKFAKILGFILGGFVLLIVGAVVVVTTFFPKIRPPAAEKVEATAARLERGA